MDKCTFLRAALRAKQPALGTWLTLPGTAVARTIASVPGLQWMLIDAEHGQITDKDYYEVRLRSGPVLFRLLPPLSSVPNWL